MSVNGMNETKIGILGAGTWGVTLSRLLCGKGYDVTVWSPVPGEAESLSAARSHPNLPDMVIPDAVRFTSDISAACRGMDAVVFAVPSVYMRDTASKAKPFLSEDCVTISVAKGFEKGTLLTMSGILESELGTENKIAVLSGPTHAEEVSIDLPTTIVAASADPACAEWVQDLFMTDCFRVYTNHDVLGVEISGALKNIVAIAAGISEGLGYGDNAKAALITRGIAEIARLGVEMGCSILTFCGLAGIGDLVVTATSRHSRNNRAGFLIGQGMKPDEAVHTVGMVVEGINALEGAIALAARYRVEMPIVEAVNDIVVGGADPKTVVLRLMTRERKNEIPSRYRNF